MLATIHQPSSDMYINFDRLILMCDGHIVYQGSPVEMPTHLGNAGIQFKKYCNPADIAMRELSINYPKKEKDEQLI